MAKVISALTEIGPKTSTMADLPEANLPLNGICIAIIQFSWDELRLALLRQEYRGKCVVSTGERMPDDISQPADCHQLSWPPNVIDILRIVAPSELSRLDRDPSTVAGVGTEPPEPANPARDLVQLNVARLRDLARRNESGPAATEVAAAQSVFGYPSENASNSLTDLACWLESQPVDTLIRRPVFADWKNGITVAAHTLKHVANKVLSFNEGKSENTQHPFRTDEKLWASLMKACFSLPSGGPADPAQYRRMIEPCFFLLVAAWLMDQTAGSSCDSALETESLTAFRDGIIRLEQWNHGFSELSQLRSMANRCFD